MEFDEPMPFEEALAYVAEKGLLPTSLGAREIREKLQGELTRRSVFSARVTQADILTELQERIEELASGNVVGSSFTRAKAELLDAIRRTGYSPSPDDRGTVKDLTSDARLQLMIETNVLDAQGHGTFIAGNDPIALEVNPGQELVRFGNPDRPREWEARWQAAIAETTQEGATDGSDRMVALKGHPVWAALGRGAGGYEDTLGNPWPPFAFNSTMGVIPVSAEECEELGILTPGASNPGEVEPGFNDSLQADKSRFAPALAIALAANPELTLRGGVLTVR